MLKLIFSMSTSDNSSRSIPENAKKEDPVVSLSLSEKVLLRKYILMARVKSTIMVI